MENCIHSIYFSDKVQTVAPHYHDCHQILFVTSGAAQVILNGSRKTVTAGSIMLFSRFEQHDVQGMSKRYSRYVLRIRPELKYTSNPKLFSILFNRSKHFKNIIDISSDFNEVRRLFDRMLYETDAVHSLQSEMVDLLLNELLIYIYRNAAVDCFVYENPAFQMVLNVQKDLSEHFKENFTLNEIAASCSVSPSNLSHNFKKITGMSVMAYLLSCRIAEAKKMLTKTDFSVKEVVDACGFSDFSNFSRTFKKITGFSPTDYAKKYKQC